MTEYEKREQDRQTWLDSLKPGDRFAVEIRIPGYGHGRDYTLGTIKNVTKSRARFDLTMDRGYGLLKVNRDGYETSGGGYYAREFIEPVTDQILSVIKGRELNRRLGKLVMDKDGRDVRKDLTHDQIERIIAILEEPSVR